MGGRVHIAVNLLSPDWRDALPSAAALGRRAARAAFRAVAVQNGNALPPSAERPAAPVELSLVLADNALVHRLNLQYRGVDKPTNVLSFGGLSEDPAVPGDLPIMLGDVVLARETIAAEAAGQSKPLADHFSHLVVHGVLHLLGYDHENADEAAVMESLEVTVLAALGIANPYITEVDAGLPAQA